MDVAGWMLRTVLAGVLLYALVAALAWGFQRRLLYVPDTRRIAPQAAGLTGVEEITLHTPDGASLIAWYGAARPGQPTILYFHGNAGGLVDRAERIKAYLARGRGMLMLAYRGYSGSSGRPSEQANIADAELALRYLEARGVPAERVIAYGESLGSGVAATLAVRHPLAGTILDAPYTSIVDVAAEVYWFLPVRGLMSDRYETLRVIGGLRSPLLVVHGERDEVIPVEMGRRILEAAGKAQSRDIVIFPQAGHSDHYLHGSFEAIQVWIDRIWPRLDAAGRSSAQALKQTPGNKAGARSSDLAP